MWIAPAAIQIKVIINQLRQGFDKLDGPLVNMCGPLL